MPKAAKCRPSRGKVGPRGGGRGGASTTSATGRRGVAGNGKSQPRNDDGSRFANGAGWDEYYTQLKKFKRREGHCNVPTKRSGSLGNWVKWQRQLEREERLAQERIDRLDKLGFDWGTTRDERWGENFEQLKAFQEEHGHCRVPRSHALGIWVKDQRKFYRNSELAPERRERLDGLGFDPGVSHGKVWKERFEELILYKKKHGHCNVPRGSGSLANWVNTQPKSKKGQGNGKLTDEQIQQLDKIGFEWNIGPQNQRASRKREANCISEDEDVASDAEPHADESATGGAANNREDLTSSRTSDEADGPSEQNPKEARRRRWERRRETSAAITSEVVQSVGAANTAGAGANSAVDFAAPSFARLRITIKEGLSGIVLSQHPENKSYSIISHVPSNSNAAGNGPEIFDVIRPPRLIQVQGNHRATEQWFHQHLESLHAKVSVFRKYSWDADVNRALSKAFPGGECCSFKYFVHSIVIRKCGNVGITVREEPFGEVNMTVITRVEPHSLGKKLGLKRGDIIFKPTRSGVKLSNLHEWFKERISYNSTDDLPPFAFKVLRLQDRAKLRRMLS